MQVDYSRHPDGSYRQVLLVERDATLLNSIARALELEGFLVTRSTNLKNAENSIQKNLYDAIILSDQFSDENTLQFIKNLRGLGTSAPIIFLNTKLNNHFQTLITESGANYILTKPFTFHDLRNCLYRCFEQACSDLFVPPPVWSKTNQIKRESLRTSLWLGILASILIGVALYFTMIVVSS
ncbi:MAG: response regulator [Chthoniobacterales bacterium]|nr:response regulator [Chthoniobacterales bacterium]